MLIWTNCGRCTVPGRSCWGHPRGLVRRWQRSLPTPGSELCSCRDARNRSSASPIGSTERSRVVLAVDLSRSDAAARVLAHIGDLEIGFAAFAAGADDHGCDFVDAALDDWVALVQRNVVTTTILSYHLGASMKARGRGGLVYVSSGAGWNGGGRIAVYSATKAYDRNFGEGLWAELSPHGVHVLTIQLQATNTPALQRLFDAHNLTVAGLDEPVDVARIILERLPDGPSYSMGEDDGRVLSELSAARRREQVIASTQRSAAFFGER